MFYGTRGIVILPVALLLFARCAAGSTGRARFASGEEVKVEISNDLTPQRGVTVRAVSGNGARTLIGTLLPGQAKVLRFEQPAFRGSYVFVAERDDAGPIRSIPVVLEPGMQVIWTLRNNILRVGSPR